MLRNAPRDDAPAQATLWRGDWLEVRGETRRASCSVYDHRHERPGYVRPAHRARPPPGGGEPARAGGGGALPARRAPATSRWASATRRWRCGRRRPGWTPARSWRRSARWPTGWRGARRRRAPMRATPRCRRTSRSRELRREVQVRRRRRGGLGGKARRHGRACATTARRGSACSPRRRRRRSSGRARRCSWRARGCQPSRCCRPPSCARGTTAGCRRCRRSTTRPRGRCRRALRRAACGCARAEAFAWRAFDEARRGNVDAASRAEGAAVRELALADRGVLAPEDVDALRETSPCASRRRAGRPKRRRATPASAASAWSSRRATQGETCVRVVHAGKTRSGSGRTLHLRRRVAERAALGAVGNGRDDPGPAAGGVDASCGSCARRRRELGVRDADARDDGSGRPATSRAAGFSPDGARLLVVREARGGGQVTRRFQVMETATLAVERWAASADKLGAFKRWGAPSWRAGTLALR